MSQPIHFPGAIMVDVNLIECIHWMVSNQNLIKLSDINDALRWTRYCRTEHFAHIEPDPATVIADEHLARSLVLRWVICGEYLKAIIFMERDNNYSVWTRHRLQLHWFFCFKQLHEWVYNVPITFFDVAQTYGIPNSLRINLSPDWF